MMIGTWRLVVAMALLATGTLVGAEQTAFAPLWSYDREFRRSMGFHLETLLIRGRFQPSGVGILDLDVSGNTKESLRVLTRELRKDYPSDLEHFFTQLELIFVRAGQPVAHVVTRIRVYGEKVAFTYLATKTPYTLGWPVDSLRTEKRFTAANLMHETAVGLFRAFTSPAHCENLPIMAASEAPAVLGIIEPELRTSYLTNLAAAALEFPSICESVQAARPDSLGVLLGPQAHVAIYGSTGPVGLFLSRLKIVGAGQVSVDFGPYLSFAREK